MSTAELSVPLEQSDLSTFVEEALKIIHEASKGQAIRQLSVIENPRESWLWDFDFMKLNQWSLDTSDDEVWSDDDYSSCFWACVRAKKQELRTNMLSAKQALYIEGMSDVQCHNHHMQEWDPWKTSLGEGVMPMQSEREYPARFVWQMAGAIICKTAKGTQFRLKVPRSPALQPLVGADRPWWITLPSNTVSEFMIASTTLQLNVVSTRE